MSVLEAVANEAVKTAAQEAPAAEVAAVEEVTATGSTTAAAVMVAMPECKRDLSGNWKFFRMQWEGSATQLCTQSSQIRSVMGKECLRIYQHLQTFEAIKTDVKKSLDALEEHFKPICNVVYERYMFNSCRQGPSKSVDQYMTRLHQVVSSCNYGSLEDQILRDRLVRTIKDNAVRSRLFKEAKLTVTKAMEGC